MRRIAVIGLGRFGMAAIERLQEIGGKVSIEVIAIDKDKTLMETAQQYTSNVVALDATHKTSLEEIINDVDSVAICVRDAETAFKIVALLRELEVPEIVVRTHDSDVAKAFMRFGVQDTIIPERTAAFALVDNLVRPGVREHHELFPGMTFAAVDIPPAWVGKKISQLNLEEEELNILTIKRPLPPPKDGEEGDDPQYEFIPGYRLSGAILRENDFLLVLGKEEAINRFENAIARLTNGKKK